MQKLKISADTLCANHIDFPSIIHMQIYRVFSREENPDSTANTSRSLPLHMDYQYYESPPGVQLLQCLRYVYSMAVASMRQKMHSPPLMFDILVDMCERNYYRVIISYTFYEV